MLAVVGMDEAGLWAGELESVFARVAGRFSRVDLRWRMRDYVTTPVTVRTNAAARIPATQTDGLSAEARAAVEADIPAETRRGYAGDWTRFTAWCASVDRQALPATGDTLTEYLTHLKHEDKSPATPWTAPWPPSPSRTPPPDWPSRPPSAPAGSSRATRPNARSARTSAADPAGPLLPPRPCSGRWFAATDTTTAIGRRDVAVFGASKSTVHRRFLIWSRAGVWGQLHQKVLQLLDGQDLLSSTRPMSAPLRPHEYTPSRPGRCTARSSRARPAPPALRAAWRPRAV
ncbi:hypothetical protein ADK77_02640 [Streptomyces antibioticus]|nr:hypothetical protein ADK77_02640 [Streptomyces antibioticus]